MTKRMPNSLTLATNPPTRTPKAGMTPNCSERHPTTAGASAPAPIIVVRAMPSVPPPTDVGMVSTRWASQTGRNPYTPSLISGTTTNATTGAGAKKRTAARRRQRRFSGEEQRQEGRQPFHVDSVHHGHEDDRRQPDVGERCQVHPDGPEALRRLAYRSGLPVPLDRRCRLDRGVGRGMRRPWRHRPVRPPGIQHARTD